MKSENEVEISNITSETADDKSSGISEIKIKNLWSHEATLALITAVESRFDDMFHIHKKKEFWVNISTDLLSQHLEFNEKTCAKKWDNLLRSYKSIKYNKRKTGRGPVRFAYFHRMEDLLGSLPTNSHSLDVAKLPTCSTNTVAIEHIPGVQNFQDNSLNNKDTENETQKSKQRKNLPTEYIKLKSKYYETRKELLRQKEDVKKKYVNEIIRLKEEKLEILRIKNAIEERKVKALEALARLKDVVS